MATFGHTLLLFLLRYLLLFSPTGTSYQRPPCLGRPAMFDVAAAALAAERNVNKRYQLIGRVRCRRHRHPVIMSVHLQSSDVSTSGHFSASTTTSSSCVGTVESTCCVSPRRGTTSTAPSSVVCGYTVVDRPRPRAADDDLSVNHAGVLVMSAADVSLSLIAVTQRRILAIFSHRPTLNYFKLSPLQFRKP